MAVQITVVAAGPDDAQEIQSPVAVDHTNDRILLRKAAAANARYFAGFRFLPNIPNKAIVTAATMKFFIFDTSDDYVCTIYGELVDDAVDFAATAAIGSRARTSASAAWNDLTGGVAGSAKTTPDFSSVVQEIVDRPGWAPGNGMMILMITASSDPERSGSFESKDFGAGLAELHLSFRVPVSGVTIIN